MSQDIETTPRAMFAQALVNELDSSFFKMLGEPVRIEILKYLMLHGASDIGTIAMHMPQDRSVISRHLNAMRGAKLVTHEKQGRRSVYDVDSLFFLNKIEAIAAEIRACMTGCGISTE